MIRFDSHKENEKVYKEKYYLKVYTAFLFTGIKHFELLCKDNNG